MFHAAGYKHVPLLEAHPVEAVATNVLGTKNMVEAALAAGVERFVSFSTDKAVRPTNVLGQTKAAGEWIVSSWGDEARGQRYSSIRLANVVDATGGILPRFRGQIERGGPLTVTDPRATRLLMTSTEAVGLALVAGAVGDPGGAFWLDVRPAVRVPRARAPRCQRPPRSTSSSSACARARSSTRSRSRRTARARRLPRPGVFRTALPRIDPTRLDAWISELAGGSRRTRLGRESPRCAGSPARAKGRRIGDFGRGSTMTSSAARMTPTLRYFERRAEAFDRLYTRQSPGTRLLRVGPRRSRDLAASVVARHDAPSVLDVGCGPGRVAEAVIEAGATSYTGVDFSPHMLSARPRAPRRLRVRATLEADFLSLELPETSDIVLALGLFDYLDEPERAATWMRAHCSPDPVATFSRRDRVKTPIRRLHYELIHRCPIYFYVEADAEALLRAAGFARVEFVSRGPRGFFVTAGPS